jgi:hypothetical protein
MRRWSVLGRFRAPEPELSIRERNIQRILNPPRRTLWERVRAGVWEVEEWWCRHVTQRARYRMLDAARITTPPEWDTAQHREESLRRLAERIQADGQSGQCSADDQMPPPPAV